MTRDLAARAWDQADKETTTAGAALFQLVPFFVVIPRQWREPARLPGRLGTSARASPSGLMSAAGRALATASTACRVGMTPAKVGAITCAVVAVSRRCYPTFRNLCSERKLTGRGLSLNVCGQLVHDTSPT